MKNYFVNFALLLTLTGCGVNDHQKERSRESTPNVEQKLAGRVSLNIGTRDGEEAKLPASFEVKFFPEVDHSTQLSIAPLTPAGVIRLVADYDSKMSIGCDGAEPVIKEDIKTGVLELCGPIQFKGRKLKINATTIVLKNADLNIEFFGPLAQLDSDDYVFINSLNFELVGSNRISVYRDVNSRDDFEAPELFMYMDKIKGDGKLQINSISEMSVKNE